MRAVCIFCEEPVLADDMKFNLPIDRPVYCNLIVHKSCYNKQCGEGTLHQFLCDNLYDHLKKYKDEHHGKKKTPTQKYKHKKKDNYRDDGDKRSKYRYPRNGEI